MDDSFWEKKALELDNNKIDAEIDKLMQIIADDVGNRKSVLDVATGAGNVALKLANTVNSIIGIDSSEAMLGIAKKRAAEMKIENIEFSLQSAYEINFPNDTFDAVVICNSLQFMENPEKALSESRRVMKLDGILVIPTACFGETEELRSKAEVMVKSGFPAHHMFTSQALGEITGKNGFEVTKREYFHKYCHNFENSMPFAYIIARPM